MLSYKSVIALLICVAVVNALPDFADTEEDLQFESADHFLENDVENLQSDSEESEQLNIEAATESGQALAGTPPMFVIPRLQSVFFSAHVSDRVEFKSGGTVTIGFTTSAVFPAGGRLTLTYPAGFFASSSIISVIGRGFRTNAVVGPTSIVMEHPGDAWPVGSYVITLTGMTFGAATEGGVITVQPSLDCFHCINQEPSSVPSGPIYRASSGPIIPANTTRVDPETVKRQIAAAALAAHGGDHRALFATLMKHIRDNLDSMRSSSDTQLAAVTAKRDASKSALDRATQRAAERETVFSNAAAAKRAVDQACKHAQDSALMSQAVMTTATSTFNERNPVVEKELAVIAMIILKVADLKSISLQETRDMVLNLQTFEEEAKPLMEMIDIAREHAEFTKPILDLLRQLQAKLLTERDSLRNAVSSATSAHLNRKSIVEDNCSKVDVKRIELASAETEFTSAKSARNAAQLEYDDFQQVWTKTNTQVQAFRLAYVSESRTLDRFKTCALAPDDSQREYASFSIDRFSTMQPAWGYWGATDATTFQINKATAISGTSICKWISGPTHSDIKISIIEGPNTNGRVLATRVLKDVKLDTGAIIPLMFERPIMLSPGTAYTVTAFMMKNAGILTQHFTASSNSATASGFTLTTQATNWNGPFGNNGSGDRSGQNPRLFFTNDV